MILKALALALVLSSEAGALSHVSNKKVNASVLYKDLVKNGVKVVSMRCGEDQKKPDECRYELASNNAVDPAPIIAAHVYVDPADARQALVDELAEIKPRLDDDSASEHDRNRALIILLKLFSVIKE